jgi:hypothetical protein
MIDVTKSMVITTGTEEQSRTPEDGKKRTVNEKKDKAPTASASRLERDVSHNSKRMVID